MSKSKTDRREFLKITGVSLTGLALVGKFGVPQVLANTRSSGSETALENWLLNTGADELSPSLFTDVLQKLK